MVEVAFDKEARLQRRTFVVDDVAFRLVNITPFDAFTIKPLLPLGTRTVGKGGNLAALKSGIGCRSAEKCQRGVIGALCV